MSATLNAPYQVGTRVHVDCKGQRLPGRISSIRRSDRGVEYVIRTDASAGGPGRVVNIWTTSGHSSFITPAEDHR